MNSAPVFSTIRLYLPVLAAFKTPVQERYLGFRKHLLSRPFLRKVLVLSGL